MKSKKPPVADVRAERELTVVNGKKGVFATVAYRTAIMGKEPWR